MKSANNSEGHYNVHPMKSNNIGFTPINLYDFLIRKGPFIYEEEEGLENLMGCLNHSK